MFARILRSLPWLNSSRRDPLHLRVSQRAMLKVDVAVNAQNKMALRKVYLEICDDLRCAVPPEHLTESAWAQRSLAHLYSGLKFLERDGWPK